MTVLADLFDRDELDRMLSAGYVRRQTHPTLPLAILNYTEQAVYDRAWNAATRQCRGLIYDVASEEVVARPFPKFFNHGEPAAPDLDLYAPAVVTDKLDGSLGILYPVGSGHMVATRGSFTSEQALHASKVYVERYERDLGFSPPSGLTYLFEIVYPGNRIVVDYGETDDLFLLDVIEVKTGLSMLDYGWPGPRVKTHPYATLAEALAAEPRPGAEGLVVALAWDRVKIKQDDYVALHRILTGTNARHVWEYAAVAACRDLISEPKHWGSYLGIDPARAEQLLAVGDGWLEQAGIPDEFYAWVARVFDDATERAGQDVVAGLRVAAQAEQIEDRKDRYAFVQAHAGVYVREVMRMAVPTAGVETLDALRLRAWREACPDPTAPFARSEAVA